MMDVMTKITISADVTGLATVVAGLREGFEGPSAVNVHRDARRECARRCALLQGLRQWEDVSGGIRRVCVGEQHMSSV
jgi:hypothetical protein